MRAFVAIRQGLPQVSNNKELEFWAVLYISFVFLWTKGCQKWAILPFFGAGYTSKILNGYAPEYATGCRLTR